MTVNSSAQIVWLCSKGSRRSDILINYALREAYNDSTLTVYVEPATKKRVVEVYASHGFRTVRHEDDDDTLHEDIVPYQGPANPNDPTRIFMVRDVDKALVTPDLRGGTVREVRGLQIVRDLVGEDALNDIDSDLLPPGSVSPENQNSRSEDARQVYRDRCGLTDDDDTMKTETMLEDILKRIESNVRNYGSDDDARKQAWDRLRCFVLRR